MLTVSIPTYCKNEINYIIEQLLGEFLGLNYCTLVQDNDEITIAAEGRVIHLPATFFATAQKNWLRSESVPHQPLMVWDTRETGLDINLVDGC